MQLQCKSPGPQNAQMPACITCQPLLLAGRPESKSHLALQRHLPRASPDAQAMQGDYWSDSRKQQSFCALKAPVTSSEGQKQGHFDPVIALLLDEGNYARDRRRAGKNRGPRRGCE